MTALKTVTRKPKDVVLNIRLPLEDMVILDDICTKGRMTIDSFVRMALLHVAGMCLKQQEEKDAIKKKKAIKKPVRKAPAKKAPAKKKPAKKAVKKVAAKKKK